MFPHCGHHKYNACCSYHSQCSCLSLTSPATPSKDYCLLTYLVFVSLTHFWRADAFSKSIPLWFLIKISFKIPLLNASPVGFFFSDSAAVMTQLNFHLLAHKGREFSLLSISVLWCYANAVWCKPQQHCLCMPTGAQRSVQHNAMYQLLCAGTIDGNNPLN